MIFKNQTVLENVNLKLESGKIYGLVGRNGSGKSVSLILSSPVFLLIFASKSRFSFAVYSGMKPMQSSTG